MKVKEIMSIVAALFFLGLPAGSTARAQVGRERGRGGQSKDETTKGVL